MSSSPSFPKGEQPQLLHIRLDRCTCELIEERQRLSSTPGEQEEEATEISYRHGSPSVLSLTHLGRSGIWHPQGPHPAQPHPMPLHFGGPRPGDGAADG